MARPVKLGDDLEQLARQIVQEARSAREYRTGLSVLIPKACAVSNAVAGQVLGVGALDWMLAQKSDTHHMGAFLRHVSQRHPGEFVVMVIDGAPSHRAFGLEVPRTW